ncbi:MAG: phage minor head protein, partial [Rhodoglobus sp.]|nr:phage minor head protein [Rhodoglobus sp.]
TGASDAAMQQSVDHLSKEIGVYAKRWDRSPAPVSGVHTASHFIDKRTALRNLTVIDPDTMKAVKKTNTRSVARYGDDLITAFENEMAVGKVVGYSVDEMTDRLLGVGDSVFNGERYRAERIVVNETLNAYSTARHESLQTFAEDVGVAKRMWVSVGEDGRTCETCLAMHGQLRGVDEPFSSNGTPIARPPRHVRCRCVEILWLDDAEPPAMWKPRE